MEVRARVPDQRIAGEARERECETRHHGAANGHGRDLEGVLSSGHVPGALDVRNESDVVSYVQAGCITVAWTAVMTTSATSLGWEIMTTCDAPSISVTVAPIRS